MYVMSGLNLRIHNATLYQTNFSLVTSKDRKGFVDVSESSFGFLNVSSGFTVTITNCIIDGNTMTGVATSMYIVGSVLSVSNFTFNNLSASVMGRASITAISTIVTMYDVHVINNDVCAGNISES